MIECAVHPGIFSLPGKTCATCIKFAKAEAKREKERNGKDKKPAKDIKNKQFKK